MVSQVKCMQEDVLVFKERALNVPCNFFVVQLSSIFRF